MEAHDMHDPTLRSAKPPVDTVASRQQTDVPAHPSSGRTLTGVFEVLVNEHRKAALQFERIMHEPAASREQSWPILRRQLLSHDRAEELEVYSALEGYGIARDIVEHHHQQAAELEAAINELAAIDYGAERWMDRFNNLHALFEQHAKDEEDEYFPRAQELLGESSARDLHERFVSAQRDVIHKLV
jgi:hemerythrin superfamily protein